MLTKSEILAMPETEYMNGAQLEFFKELLQANSSKLDSRRAEIRDLLTTFDNPADVADKASVEEERRLLVSELERCNNESKAINASLKLIAEGDYGWCESSGEAIGIKRLVVMPTATLTVFAQELDERKRGIFDLKKAA